MQLRILLVASALSGALALPADTPRRLADVQSATSPPAGTATSSSLSIWSAAKRFFSTREKMKAKASNMPAPSPDLKMDSKYGVSFKTMITWYCAKEENKPKSICHLKQQGQPDPIPSPDTTKALQEIKSTWMAYCKMQENKAKLVCVQSAVGTNKSKGIISKPAISRGIPHQRPGGSRNPPVRKASPTAAGTSTTK